jgi:hypothetical protein
VRYSRRTLRALLLGKHASTLRARFSPRSILLTLKVLTTKTARFAAMVEACGAPQVYTLWQTPKKDRRLQTQIRQSRIMTIQRSDGGADFGCVGFIERKNAIYLNFPKSLKRFADQRIVGIKWELMTN